MRGQFPPWFNPPGNAMGAGTIARPIAETPNMAGANVPVFMRPGAAGGASQTPGDATTIPVIASAAGSFLSLLRPPPGMRRSLLIVQNQLVGTDLFFAFGRDADQISSQSIPAGGNLLLDQALSIPQNELYLFFSIAGRAVITFVNASA